MLGYVWLKKSHGLDGIRLRSRLIKPTKGPKLVVKRKELEVRQDFTNHEAILKRCSFLNFDEEGHKMNLEVEAG